MAKSNSRRAPRIRKSAPTVRELAEAARSKEDEASKPKRIKRVSAKTSTPLKKLTKTQPARLIAMPFRWIGKALSWLTPRYVINSWRELRQVQWPSRRETWRLTLAVFIFALVFGSLVAGVDKGLDELFKKVVLK